MAEKVVIDDAHGAQGKEMSDEDVAELEADTRGNVEVDAEPQPEIADPVDEDLPEGITEPPEVAEAAEPEVNPEVERLKELGLYRPGLIESWDDLGKSYKHIEGEFSRRPTVERPAEPAYDPKADMDALVDELQTNPVAAIYKIANAAQDGTREQVNKLKDNLFYSTHMDAADYKSEIAEIQKETGLGIQDSFDLAKGRDSGKVADKATLTEKKRATERQVALREKPGGVRTAPVDAAKAVAAAATGGGSADEKIDEMIKILEKHNMGAKD